MDYIFNNYTRHTSSRLTGIMIPYRIKYKTDLHSYSPSRKSSVFKTTNCLEALKQFKNSEQLNLMGTMYKNCIPIKVIDCSDESNHMTVLKLPEN